MKKKMWIIIAAAVAVVAVAALCIGFACRNNPAGQEPQNSVQQNAQATAGEDAQTPDSADPTGSVTAEEGTGAGDSGSAGTSGEATPGAENPAVSGGTDQSEQSYYPVVSFLSNDVVIAAQRVSVGSYPDVPSGDSGYDHLVFLGWDKAITKVTEDVQYHAVYQDITGKSNVFILDTLYTNDPDNARVTLSLKGAVNLCVADLQIKYDPTVIRVEEVLNADPSVKYNILPNEGRIKVSLMLSDNLEFAMDCLQFRVSFVDKSKTTAQMDIVIDDAAVLSGGTTLTDVDAQSISGKIVLIAD